jgi:chromate reductase
MNICLITVSDGKNMELARAFEKEFQSKGAKTQLLDLVNINLPLYTSQNEKLYQAPELLKSFKEDLHAHAFVFIAPEYNGGPPPAFSNFLAWVSRSTKDWRETFNGKPAAIATHSAGGGLNVLTIMRLQLAYLGLNLLGRQIHTTPQKPLEEASLRVVCEQLMKLAQ